jgi:hypothetical protein
MGAAPGVTQIDVRVAAFTTVWHRMRDALPAATCGRPMR